MPRIKAVKMKPRVKNGAKTIIHHRPLSWILDMPTFSHPLLISLCNQLDRSPAAMLPMTTSILRMAWDKAPATSNRTRMTQEIDSQINSHLELLPSPPTLLQFDSGPFLQPLSTSSTTAPPSTFLKQGPDANSLPTANITFKEFQLSLDRMSTASLRPSPPSRSSSPSRGGVTLQLQPASRR